MAGYTTTIKQGEIKNIWGWVSYVLGNVAIASVPTVTLYDPTGTAVVAATGVRTLANSIGYGIYPNTKYLLDTTALTVGCYSAVFKIPILDQYGALDTVLSNVTINIVPTNSVIQSVDFTPPAYVLAFPLPFFGVGNTICGTKANAGTGMGISTSAFLTDANLKGTYVTSHIAEHDFTDIRVHYTNLSVETPNTNTVKYGSALRFNGNFYPFTFNGAHVGQVPQAGPLTSDKRSDLSFVKGQQYQIVTYYELPTGGRVPVMIFTSVSVAGEGYLTNVDYTLVNTNVTSVALNAAAPQAITGTVSYPVPSIFLLGDSIIAGQGSTQVDTGCWYWALNGDFSYIKKGRSSDTIATFVSAAGHINGLPYIKGCTHCILAFGHNDLYTLGSSAATVAALIVKGIALVKAMQPGIRVYIPDVTPTSSTTDQWATTGNQTVVNPSANTQRIALNALIAAGLTGADYINGLPYIPITNLYETAPGSSIIVVNGSAFGYTVDGTHPSDNFGQTILYPSIGSILASTFVV